MKQSTTFKQFMIMLLSAIFGMLSIISSASAQQIIVISHYQEIPGKKMQLSQVLDNEVIKRLAKVNGLDLMKFFYDSATGKRGSVLLWKG